MKEFRGLDFQALRESAAASGLDERSRTQVVDMLDELLLDAFVTETLVEAGRGDVIAQVFWAVTLDSEDASIEIMRTEGSVPAGWAAAAALRVRPILSQGGALLSDDRLMRLAEGGVTTITMLLFVLSADGGASVLYARHPDVEAKAGAAMMLDAIDRTIRKRHVIN